MISNNLSLGSNFRSFFEQTKYAANTFSQQQLEDMAAVLRKSLKRRFAGKRKTPKYGTLNKGFTEPELQHFLRNVKSEKFRLLFKYQAFVGLRIGEACELHASNIGLDNRELRIRTEKAQVMDSLRIPADLFTETMEYIARNAVAIKAANGYIFFKDNDNNRNGKPYVDKNYARKVFRETITKIGLDYIYGESEETYQNHETRSLHRLTTHSLRHYAIA